MQDKTLKYFLVPLVVLLTDFYIFPISLTVSSAVNTKMMLAVAGIVFLLLDQSESRFEFVDKTFIGLSVWACAISLVCYVAVIYNATNDYTYVTYIVSMWVWLFGAYALVRIIGWLHGHISLSLVGGYIAAVCVAQCIFALGYEYSVWFANKVDSLHIGLVLIYDTKERMQGFSAALDPAGIRFAASLVIIAYAAVNGTPRWKGFRPCMMLAFCMTAVVGNMIARTTSVGALLGLLYLLYVGLAGNHIQKLAARNTCLWLGCLLALAIPYMVDKYNSDENFREDLRFGFEGFFSLAETGKWEVSSNDILKNMIVFPDNTKTWVIGDGYIENPSKGRDPYYVGENYTGYYKNTDIGYLRFIFYCGLTGLICFIGFFIYVTMSCIHRYPRFKMLFFILLLLTFGIWAKVSTDIFQFFAIFLAIPPSLMSYSYNKADDE